MPDNIELIAVVLLIASLCAVIVSRLNQLPMVGYVLGGVVLGPNILNFVPAEHNVRLLAELGVVLLLFIVGIELSLESFKRTYRAATAISLSLVLLSVLFTAVIRIPFGWTNSEALIYAFVISLSSTAVGIKLLKQLHLTSEDSGQIALSVLLAQDLIFVPMILILNTLGGDSNPGAGFILSLAALVISILALIIFLSSKGRIHLLFEKWVEKHDELVPVAALTWCFAGAAAALYLGLSPAFGAFLAGLIIGNSYSKDLIFTKIEPLQSVLLMVFFVSIGLLLDLSEIWNSLGVIFLLVLGSMLIKTIFCILLFKRFLFVNTWRYSYATGLAISQIGEFSFVIASTAAGNNLISPHSYKLLVAVIALSLTISPFWITFLNKMMPKGTEAI